MKENKLLNSIWRFPTKSLNYLEKYLPILSFVFFILGIWLASVSTAFADFVNAEMNLIVGSYGYIAPVAIYVILTPSLARLLFTKKINGRQFTTHALYWLSSRRFIACVWAAIFTAVVFGMPLYANGTISMQDSIYNTIASLAWMLTNSTYFYAIYLSLITVILCPRVPQVQNLLQGISDGVEKVGKYFIPFVPLFMLSVGAYLYILPSILIKENGRVSLAPLSILGFSLDTTTSMGIILAYLAGALLTGVASIIWHFVLLLIVKYKVPWFSIKKYFRDYWVRVYPLLWATSSEALSVPLNLHLVKKHYPLVKPEIRQFVLGAGSFLNINGTLICVFILAGLVSTLLGIKISLIQLLLAIPLVFLLGYGVPGIPGELLLFAGPIAILLNIPQELMPVFLALYISLQLGLPDSFRSGTNSTDNCVLAILLNDIYLKYEIKADVVRSKVDQFRQIILTNATIRKAIITDIVLDHRFESYVKRNFDNLKVR